MYMWCILLLHMSVLLLLLYSCGLLLLFYYPHSYVRMLCMYELYSLLQSHRSVGRVIKKTLDTADHGGRLVDVGKKKLQIVFVCKASDVVVVDEFVLNKIELKLIRNIVCVKNPGFIGV